MATETQTATQFDGIETNQWLAGITGRFSGVSSLGS